MPHPNEKYTRQYTLEEASTLFGFDAVTGKLPEYDWESKPMTVEEFRECINGVREMTSLPPLTGDVVRLNVAVEVDK